MSELDDTTEVFKQAVTSTMRAISGNDELTVSFGRGKPYIQGNKARIPLPQGGMTEAELATLRGTSDKFALQERYHDDAKHRENRPETGLAQQVFDSVEDARIAGIGSYLMKGVEDNLTAQLESHCEEQNYLEIETQAQALTNETETHGNARCALIESGITSRSLSSRRCESPATFEADLMEP